MKTFFQDLKKKYTYGVQKKIFYPYSLLYIVLIVTLVMVTSMLITKAMLKNTYENIKGLDYRVSYSIDTAVSTLERLSANLDDNNDVNSYLSENMSQFDRYKLQMKLLGTIGYLGELYNYGDIDFFLTGSKYAISTNRYHNTIDFTQYQDKLDIWYIPFIKSDRTVGFLTTYVPPSKTDETPRIAVARKYFSNEGQLTGITVFSIKDSYFANLLNNSRLDESGLVVHEPNPDRKMQYMLIADQEGDILYLSDNSLRTALKGREEEIRDIAVKGNFNQLFRIYDSNYVVTSVVSSKTGLNVISLNSDESIRENINKINFTIYVLLAGCILVMLLVSNYISRKITGRIKKLSSVMKRSEIKNDVVYVNITGNDEIAELGNSFNVMMKKFVENQILKNEAEIAALQQQINPHFLYNTLGVVNSISQVYGCEEITVISEKLADMFRYSINRDFHEFVPVKDEIMHVENYLTIQKIRFSDKFTIAYAIDGEIVNNKIIRFVLQPLVENAIYHGLEKKKGRGLLTIKASKAGEDMQFEIIDNGIGIEGAELKNLREYLNSPGKKEKGVQRRSIGLMNVNSRIKLIYGEKYGIAIQSEPFKGTSVSLRVPIIPQADELNAGGDANAKNTGC